MSALVIAFSIATIIFAYWVIATQHLLKAMDENVSGAMNQIGSQLSGRYEALTSLLELTEDYDCDKSIALMQVVKSRRININGKSSASDVLKQAHVIDQTLYLINSLAREHPQLICGEGYNRQVNAVESYRRDIRSSLLDYNDGVTRYNRAVEAFPDRLVAKTMGLRQRDYLEVS